MRNPFSQPIKLVMLSISAAGLVVGLGSLALAKGAVKPAAQAAPVQAPATSLTWNYDLRSALNTAKTSRRWVLVDMFTEHCGWCKRLDRDTFSSPDVAKALGNNFVWVKCDTDNPSTGAWVKDKYEPQGYPCILILDPYGTEKGRIMGYQPPDRFINSVAQIVRR